MGKLVIVTAPSGSGKTTIVRHLLNSFSNLSFSVSATTRPRRPSEVEGIDYFFLTPEEFKSLVRRGDFVEWEEVYENQYYGTLKSELKRLWAAGSNIIFDIDVKGAVTLKNTFPEQSIVIFVKPPSWEELVRRLQRRRTENDESLRKRLARAEEEMLYEQRFDHVLVNDNLAETLRKAERLVGEFLEEEC